MTLSSKLKTRDEMVAFIMTGSVNVPTIGSIICLAISMWHSSACWLEPFVVEDVVDEEDVEEEEEEEDDDVEDDECLGGGACFGGGA